MKNWQLQEAKSRLSDLVEQACGSGPQIITKRGCETVVVLSIADYRKLTHEKGDLVDLLKQAPKADLDLSRDKNLPRALPL
jgi:antitoxin Phd